MADVEALCPRVLVIHHGSLLFDGSLRDLARRFGTTKTIRVQLGDDAPPHERPTDLDAVVADAARRGLALDDLDMAADGELTVRVDREHAPRVAALLLERLDVIDVSIEEPPIEDAIDRVFSDG